MPWVRALYILSLLSLVSVVEAADTCDDTAGVPIRGRKLVTRTGGNGERPQAGTIVSYDSENDLVNFIIYRDSQIAGRLDVLLPTLCTGEFKSGDLVTYTDASYTHAFRIGSTFEGGFVTSRTNNAEDRVYELSKVNKVDTSATTSLGGFKVGDFVKRGSNAPSRVIGITFNGNLVLNTLELLKPSQAIRSDVMGEGSAPAMSTEFDKGSCSEIPWAKDQLVQTVYGEVFTIFNPTVRPDGNLTIVSRKSRIAIPKEELTHQVKCTKGPQVGAVFITPKGDSNDDTAAEPSKVRKVLGVLENGNIIGDDKKVYDPHQQAPPGPAVVFEGPGPKGKTGDMVFTNNRFLTILANYYDRFLIDVPYSYSSYGEDRSQKILVRSESIEALAKEWRDIKPGIEIATKNQTAYVITRSNTTGAELKFPPNKKIGIVKYVTEKGTVLAETNQGEAIFKPDQYQVW